MLASLADRIRHLPSTCLAFHAAASGARIPDLLSAGESQGRDWVAGIRRTKRTARKTDASSAAPKPSLSTSVCSCAPPRPALTVIKTKYATFTRTATAWKKNGPAAAAVLESALPLPLPLPLALPPAPAPVSVSVEEDQVDHAFARHLCPLCPPGKNANRNRNCCKRRKTVTRTVRKTRTVTRKRIVTTTRPTIKNQVVSGRVYVGFFLFPYYKATT